MNATLISPVYPLRGGIAESGKLLLKALVKTFDELDIISYRRMYPRFLFPGKSEFVRQVKFPYSWCAIDALNPLTWFRVARSIKTDVVIIRYWTPALALCIGTLAWLLRKKKIIFIVDNVTPHEKFPFSKILTKFALRRGDGFVFFSEYVKIDFLKIGKDAMTWFPIKYPNDPKFRVVSMPIIDPGEKIISKKEAKEILGIKDKKVILFFGLVRKYKGLDTLIKAMPDILKEVDVRLLVVGEFYETRETKNSHHKMINRYQDMITELGLNDNITVVPKYVEKVAPYFCATDVVVLPYKSATQSGVVRLAQYFKKPCIVTDVGGLSEMVNEQTGYVVEENNISDAVIDFFLNQEEDEISDRWDFSGIPTWDDVVGAIEELG